MTHEQLSVPTSNPSIPSHFLNHKVTQSVTLCTLAREAKGKTEFQLGEPKGPFCVLEGVEFQRMTPKGTLCRLIRSEKCMTKRHAVTSYDENKLVQ